MPHPIHIPKEKMLRKSGEKIQKCVPSRHSQQSSHKSFTLAYTLPIGNCETEHSNIKTWSQQGAYTFQRRPGNPSTICYRIPWR